MSYSPMLFEGRQAYIILDELVDVPATAIEAWGKIVEDVGTSRGPFGDANVESGEFYKEYESYVRVEL